MNILSKEAQLFIERCYKDNKPVACNPLINAKYEFGDKEVKFTNEILDEIINSGKVMVTNRTEKMVMLCGINNLKESNSNEINQH